MVRIYNVWNIYSSMFYLYPFGDRVRHVCAHTRERLSALCMPPWACACSVHLEAFARMLLSINCNGISDAIFVKCHCCKHRGARFFTLTVVTTMWVTLTGCVLLNDVDVVGNGGTSKLV